MDDLKTLHKGTDVTNEWSALNKKHGQEVHKGLGMTINYSTPRAVEFSMPGCTDKMLEVT